jgi:hypothetical protein
LENFQRYNDFVLRSLPPAWRTGKIQRRLTWPKDVKTAVPQSRINRARRTLIKAAALPHLPKMTQGRYLEAAGIAYDSCLKELRALSPLKKYRKRADGRHGGLLDLARNDAEGFSKWFRSGTWSGTHPWEIISGHPHGIMLSPRYHEENGLWSYDLWVDSEGWYGDAAKMAIALGDRKIPFEFHDGQNVLDALEGLDEVEVGPRFDCVRYEDLVIQRPDAKKSIRWDPIPRLGPITREQVERVKRAEIKRND